MAMGRESARVSRRTALLAEWLFLLAGFACMGWYLYSLSETQLYQSYANYKLEAVSRGQQSSLIGYLRHALGGADTLASLEGDAKSEQKDPLDQPQRKPRTGDLIGRIEIPRVNVSAVLREGVDDQTLKKSAGHVPNTALPGEQGNVGVAAHRDTFFRGLRQIREGDRIRMVTPEGTHQYEVDSLKIVLPKNVEVLGPTPYKALTLVTCYPFNYIGAAPKRFIVRARQISTLASAPRKRG
jgi:sortase A